MKPMNFGQCVFAVAVACGAVGALGCGGDAFSARASDAGAGDDASFSDVDVQDSAPAPDAGSNTDAQGPDAGSSDSGAQDAGHPADSGAVDSGTSCNGSNLVTFVMKPAGGGTTQYCSGGSGSCSGDWLTIRPLAKAAVQISAPCETTCSACQPVACPAVCAAPTTLTDTGIRQVWNGTEYTKNTCGAGLSCVTPTCADPGAYIARMCASPELASTGPANTCAPGATMSCVEVTFEWPPRGGSSVVTGTLGN